MTTSLVLYELLPQNLEEMIQSAKKRGPKRDAGLDLATTTAIALDVARGLHYLHHCGVSHGCLSSRKVMVTSSGRAKLLYTPGQGVAGEQLGPAGDLYHLGLVLYEMAVGRKPDPNEVEVAYKEVPEPRLREVVRRCLDAAADARPTTDEFVDMLKLLRN